MINSCNKYIISNDIKHITRWGYEICKKNGKTLTERWFKKCIICSTVQYGIIECLTHLSLNTMVTLLTKFSQFFLTSSSWFVTFHVFFHIFSGLNLRWETFWCLRNLNKVKRISFKFHFFLKLTMTTIENNETIIVKLLLKHFNLLECYKLGHR